MNEHRTPKPHPSRTESDPFVLPPGHLINHAGHHWLEVRDYDGHTFGAICLQWQPVSRAWCHSHDYARGASVNTEYYRYLEPVNMPLFDDERERLGKILAEAEDQGKRRKEGAKIDFSPDDWKFLNKILDHKLY